MDTHDGAGPPTWLSPARQMLRLDDYALPLAAAQSQFRERFYGLNAAALLEDVYVDALENFTRKHSPEVSVDRAPRGEKSFDYTVTGTRISHKVGLGVTQIAVLWDATRRIATWSAPHPIVYHLTDRKMRTRALSLPNRPDVELSGHVRALHDVLPRERSARAHRRILIVHWPPNDEAARVLATFEVPDGAATLVDIAPFSDVWKVVAGAEGIIDAAANEIDIVLFRTPDKTELDAVTVGARLAISGGLRSGLYGIQTEWMRDLSLTQNNRAQLIPVAKVAELLVQAGTSNCFVPLPTWIAPYAATRPPSLYLTQSQSFRQLFE